VVEHFPDLDPGPTGLRARAITIEHLARMATGHREDTSETMARLDPDEPVRGFLRIEPDSEPGSVFAYNNGASYVLGAILQKRTGQSLTAYLQPRLFDPLDIPPPHWHAVGGRQAGYSGLHLTTEELAKFGQLYLQQGSWAGSPVLPPGWAAAATRAHTANPGEPEPDWRRGYGYQFWRGRYGYRGDGAYGQFCLVLPEQDAVVVTTADTEMMQTVLDAVWAHLVPAFDSPSTTSDDERLATRLGSQALPVDGAGTIAGDDWVTACDVSERPYGWALTLAAADDRLVIGCGDRKWHRSSVPVGNQLALAVEAQARWSDPETFVAELVFVHTPHRMTVSFTPTTGNSSARWRTVPLGPVSLVGLATPDGSSRPHER
jgi:hypothetical protein